MGRERNFSAVDCIPLRTISRVEADREWITVDAHAFRLLGGCSGLFLRFEMDQAGSERNSIKVHTKYSVNERRVFRIPLVPFGRPLVDSYSRTLGKQAFQDFFGGQKGQTANAQTVEMQGILVSD